MRRAAAACGLRVAGGGDWTSPLPGACRVTQAARRLAGSLGFDSQELEKASLPDVVGPTTCAEPRTERTTECILPLSTPKPLGRMTSSLARLVLLAAATLFALPVAASPWTLPEGSVSLQVGTDLQYANSEFLITGDLQEFPLDGEFYSTNLRGSVRYGISDRLEVGGTLSAGIVTFDADPIYLGDIFTTEFGDEGSAERFRGNILSLDQTTAGLGDLRIYLRHRWTPLGSVVVTGEIGLKLPTGYAAPSGTFEDDEFARGVEDDVTLGDGQADLEALLLFGFVPAPDWFIRLDAGVRLRTFGPGQQVIGELKVGTRLTPAFLPYAFMTAEHTFTEGSTIGISQTTEAPETPAREFTADLLVATPIRLDRSRISPGVGAIIQLGERELDISYRYTVWGINTARAHGISIATTFLL